MKNLSSNNATPAKINTAVIGTGFWGKNLARVFYNLEQSNLCYLCDLQKGRLDSVGSKYPGVPLINDHRAILNDKSVEAVVIATPAPSHYELAREALLAGKHTFVEKPLSLEVAHAEELIALAEKNKLILMVGHLMIYHPGVAFLKSMMGAGGLGELYYIYTRRLNLGIVRQDENALWSLAPHDISIILYLLEQEPVEVSAIGACYIRPQIEDVVFFNMLFASGVMAQVQISWLDPHKERNVTVVGSEKMVVFDDMEAKEKIKIFDKGVNITNGTNSFADFLTLREGDILIPQLKMVEPLTLECGHFLECISQGVACRSDGIEGLRVVRVLDAATRSLASGGGPMKLL